MNIRILVTLLSYLYICPIIVNAQNFYNIEIGKETLNEMEPSIAVNPNNPNQAVIAWIERQNNITIKQTLFASLEKNSTVQNQWTIVHRDTLPTDLGHNKNI